jgi:D-alanyl-D-alanine dipeptidase
MDPLAPIPRLHSNHGWRDVAITPIDDPLVPVAGISPRIFDRAQYHAWGLPGSLSRSWVRAGVAQRLAQVAVDLPAGASLVVWDAYRPLEVQAALFHTYLDELMAVHSDMPADALEDAAARYVTPPSRSVVAPPPHLTGGAVDLTLGDADGTERDLGTVFDAFVPEADTRAFEDSNCETRDLRRLLYWSMRAKGFTNYSEEWWHFDFGDQFWGLVTDRPAIYGPAANPEGGVSS